MGAQSVYHPCCLQMKRNLHKIRYVHFAKDTCRAVVTMSPGVEWYHGSHTEMQHHLLTTWAPYSWNLQILWRCLVSYPLSIISSALCHVKLTYINTFRPHTGHTETLKFLHWNFDLKRCIAVMFCYQGLNCTLSKTSSLQMSNQLIFRCFWIKPGNKHVNTRYYWGSGTEASTS